MYVYLTINKVNNKKYVGLSTKDWDKSKNYFGSGVLISKAIKKYGKNSFRKILLVKCDSKKDLLDNEIYWITHLNAVKNTNFYNLSKNNGEFLPKYNPWNKGKSISAETKSKISKTLQGNQAGKKGWFKPGQTSLRKGISHTQITKNKMSKSSRYKLTEENIHEIVKLYSTGNYTQKQIAMLFNVGQDHISRTLKKNKK